MSALERNVLGSCCYWGVQRRSKREGLRRGQSGHEAGRKDFGDSAYGRSLGRDPLLPQTTFRAGKACAGVIDFRVRRLALGT